MRKDLRIRKMIAADISGVIRIGTENKLTYWSGADYLCEVDREDSLALTAYVDKILSGFIILRLIINKEIDANYKYEAEILNFAVALDYQKQGIGKELLRYAIKEITPEKIWLEVRKSNINAIEFYTKQSFQIVGKRKHYYLNPTEDALLMKIKTSFR